MMTREWQDISTYNLYNDHTRPSSPIQVPSRRRTTASFSLSPRNWPSPSEQIFDMSPLSQEYSSSMRFNSIALKSIREGHDREPFLYQFPICGTRSCCPSQCDPRSEDLVPQTTNSVETPINSGNYRNPTAAVAQVHSEAPVRETIKDYSSSSQTAPETTKIVGFTPLIPLQNQTSGLHSEENTAKKLALPPPRRLPASSSLILSGNVEDENSPPRRSSEAGVLDFQKYLLRKIDNKKFRLFTDVMAF